MKKILVLALAAAAMVGCSNDELIGLNQETIGFDNAFVDNTTRLADPSITSVSITSETLNVWGTTQGNGTGEGLVQIFKATPVSYTSDWGYATEYNQYWIADNIYNFAALVNATPANVTLGADLLPSTVKFTTADDATDLLYAKSATYTGLASSNPKVAFTFDHLLSKVHFSFKNTMTNNASGNLYQYRVSNVQITNAHKTATCTIAGKSWAGHEGTRSAVAFGNIESVVGQVGAVHTVTSQDARLLVPAAYTDLNITCTVETLYNGELVDSQNLTLKNVAVTFEAGKAYNLVISKGAPGEKIEFTVNTVNGWGAPTPGDTNVN